MVRRWMEAFPNCYVGLTPLITNRSALPARFLVGEVPLNRLLLETDAPYFVPNCYRRDTSVRGGGFVTGFDCGFLRDGRLVVRWQFSIISS